MKLKILYEDAHILAVDKPRGVLTVGNKPGQRNLLNIVKKEYKNVRIRPLHRLDRGTSGIVLFAKTKECFHKAVEERKFAESKKTYLALIKGIPTQKRGEIDFPLASRQDKRKLLPAKTRYNTLRWYRFREGSVSLVEAIISSGRFHQIRQHLAMINHPLLMDEEYMEKRDFNYYRKIIPFGHFYLHAEKIAFKHFITEKSLEITAKIPKEFKKALSLFD